MKRFPLLLTLCLSLFVACKRKVSRVDVKSQLEQAMTHQLEENQRPNTNKAHFDVLDVEWYEESTFYRCDFKIKMTLPDGQDTTGIMRKNVSKDFNIIE